MMFKKLFALCGATLALVLVLCTAALAAGGGTAVKVRIEGAGRTLLASKTVHAHAGSVTKGGAPRGACPATSAAGALGVATRGRWDGTFSSQFHDYEITSILGERHTFASHRDFWEIFVNNQAAQVGACGIKLHRGDRLLFAAVPQKYTEYPLVIETPHHATAGQPFTVKVVWINAKGKAKPLAGAKVTVTGASQTTGRDGTIQVRVANAGTVVIHATHKRYIRAATVRVRVS